jgi:hypothetical protein
MAKRAKAKLPLSVISAAVASGISGEDGGQATFHFRSDNFPAVGFDDHLDCSLAR